MVCSTVMCTCYIIVKSEDMIMMKCFRNKTWDSRNIGYIQKTSQAESSLLLTKFSTCKTAMKFSPENDSATSLLSANTIIS